MENWQLNKSSQELRQNNLWINGENILQVKIINYIINERFHATIIFIRALVCRSLREK